MLVTNPVSGDPRVRKELRTLRQAGLEVSAVGCDPSGSLAPRDTLDGAEILRVDSSFRSGGGQVAATLGVLYRKLREVVGLAKLSARLSPDVVHAHDLDALPAAWWVSLSSGCTLVYDVHDLYPEQRADWSPLLRRILSAVERLLIRRAALVLTVNDSLAAELVRRYGVSNVVVVRNTVESPVLPSPADRARERRKLGLGPDRIAVLYHGGYTADRGLEEIIRSVSRWDRRAVLLMRGSGPLEGELRRLAAESGERERIRFLPPVAVQDMVPAASAVADIGLVPYRPTCLNNLYSLPNKLFEYLAGGIAVAASDLPEIRRLNDAVRWGVLFDPNSPEDMAAAVNRLARDAAFRARCASNGRSWSSGAGSWRRDAERLLGAYEDAVIAAGKATATSGAGAD